MYIPKHIHEVLVGNNPLQEEQVVRLVASDMLIIRVAVLLRASNSSLWHNASLSIILRRRQASCALHASHARLPFKIGTKLCSRYCLAAEKGTMTVLL